MDPGCEMPKRLIAQKGRAVMKFIMCIVHVAILALSALIIANAMRAEAQTSGNACFKRCWSERAECEKWGKPWICYDHEKACISRCKF